MRVLAVWPYPPWPSATGTQRRLARLSEELAHHVELSLIVTGPGEMTGAPAGVAVAGQVQGRRRRAQAVAGMAHALRVGEPVFTGFFRRRDAIRELREQLDRWQPDVVWAHGLAGDTVVRGVVPPAQTVLDLSDAEHLRFLRLAEVAGPARAALWRVDARRVRTWAAERLPGLRAVTVVSDEDRDAYAALAPAARFVVVPNGVDARPHPRPDPGGAQLVFLGDFGYPPNAQALAWFVSDVLPRTPSIDRVVAVGRGDPPRDPRVEATGFVDDLDDVWRRCVAMVVPVTSGGGTRLKVLDAMGAGVPVVSTAFGVGGIGAVPDVHYVQAESAEGFAEACTRAITDVELRRRVAAGAHDLVRERFAWSACLAPLLPVLESQH